MTSRLARSAPSAIWAAPSAARVSSREQALPAASPTLGVVASPSRGPAASFGRPLCARWLTGRARRPIELERATELGEAPRGGYALRPREHGRGLSQARSQRRPLTLARASEAIGLGGRRLGGLARERQAGLLLEPEGRAELGRALGEPLAELSAAPEASWWKPALTSPSRDASRARSSGCGLPSGCVAERTSDEPPLVRQEPAHVVDQGQALRACGSRCPTRAPPSAAPASRARTSRPPAGNPATERAVLGSSVIRS